MRRLSGVLALASAGAFLVAAGGWWVQRDILDSERFARHVREALASDAVRALVADEITDRVVTPSFVGTPETQELVAGQVEAAVASEAFAALFERAVEEVHRTVVERGERRPVIDLSGTESLVRDAVARVDPRLAGLVPSGALATVGVGEHGDFPDLEPFKRGLGRLVGLAMLAGLGLALLAQVAAREPNRPMVVGGFGLAVGASALFLVTAAVPGIAASRAGSPLVRDAVRAVVEEMVSGLRWEAGALAALGVALVLVGVAWGRRPLPARVV